MEFLSPMSIPKPPGPINDQNLKKGGLAFVLKLVFEIRFSVALIATEVICLLISMSTSKFLRWPSIFSKPLRLFYSWTKMLSDFNLVQNFFPFFSVLFFTSIFSNLTFFFLLFLLKFNLCFKQPNHFKFIYSSSGNIRIFTCGIYEFLAYKYVWI